MVVQNGAPVVESRLPGPMVRNGNEYSSYLNEGGSHYHPRQASSLALKYGVLLNPESCSA